MDFFTIKETPTKKKILVAPNFIIRPSKDFMVRGKSFYAIWDEEGKTWSTNEFDVQRIVDSALDEYIKVRREHSNEDYMPLYLRDFKSNSWKEYRNFLSHMPDSNKQLNTKLIFLNDEAKKTDYSSKRLPYDMEEGEAPCYEELMSTLFYPEERQKLEWSVGSILSGDSKTIQKFIILYGEHGTGKSTFLNIIQQLFEGYWVAFDAKALTSGGNSFSTEVFKNDPIVGIQHDGDLSKIADNTRINSIISHEMMVVNEKFKPSYMTKANTFLYMGTNTPVMITDSRSGIIRRLIDVYPSGTKVGTRQYYKLTEGIAFELGRIATHCLKVYIKLGKNFYANYKPIDMMYKTDVFYNFVEDSYFTFEKQDGCTLKQAYDLYKEYCTDSNLTPIAKYKFKSELRCYFRKFEDRTRDTSSGSQIRNTYCGFLKDKFSLSATPAEDKKPYSLVMDSTKSIFDEENKECLAQYATKEETPKQKWSEVETKLGEINTKRLHYIRVPRNHIVIDFDIVDEDGEKSLEKNIAAASSWPSTYAEFSNYWNFKYSCMGVSY